MLAFGPVDCVSQKESAMTGKQLLLLCFWLPVTASAQTIYKCTEPGGGVLISNSKVHKNCQAIVGETSNAVPAPRTPTARVISSSPGGFPRVEENTQRFRDADRRHILEQELAGEQRKLAQAQQELNAHGTGSGPHAAEKAAPFRERIAQHERNLQAIQKELNLLR